MFVAGSMYGIYYHWSLKHERIASSGTTYIRMIGSHDFLGRNGGKEHVRNRTPHRSAYDRHPRDVDAVV